MKNQKKLNSSDLTSEQKQEIQKLADEVLKEAELMVKDYKENPSEENVNMVIVHQNSKFLEEKE